MGMMEEMMESVIGRMSKEEKQEIMGKMMEKFFADMTVEDKQRMMEQMMPRMMMGMMSQMTGDRQGTGMPVDGPNDESNVASVCQHHGT